MGRQQRWTACNTIRQVGRLGQALLNRFSTRRQLTITSAATRMILECDDPQPPRRRLRVTRFGGRRRTNSFGVGKRSRAPFARRRVGKHTSQPDQQVERRRVHQQSEQIGHEAVIAQPAAAQIDLQFLVEVLALAALDVVVIHTFGHDQGRSARKAARWRGSCWDSSCCMCSGATRRCGCGS